MTGPRRQVAAVLAAVALASTAYFAQGGDWNQNSRLALTRALVERGSLAIDDYRSSTGDHARGVDGRSYTDKSPGPSWLAVPAFAVARALLADAGPYASALDRQAHWLTVAVVGVSSALAVAVLYLLLVGELGAPPRWAALLTAGYALGTLAFPYATLLVNHQLAGAQALIGFALCARSARPWVYAAAGHLLGWAAVSDYAALAIAAACGALLLPRGPRAWGPFLLGMAPPVLAFLAYNQHCFGGPFTLGYQREELGVWEDLAGANRGFSPPTGWKLREITVGRYRGLLIGSPFLALALPGAALWLTRGPRRDLALASTAIAAAFFAYNAGFVYWHGGHAAGPRLLVPALPYLVLLAARIPTALRPLAAVLIALSIAQMTATTAVNPQVPGGHHDDSAGRPEHRPPADPGRGGEHYADPWVQYTWPRLLAGDLGANTQARDEALPRDPADPRGQRAAFNLGHELGLPGLLSLAPLLALWLAAGLYLRALLHGPPEPCGPP